MNKMETVVYRFRPGQDLFVEIRKAAEKHDIQAGCVVAIVGSVQQASIRFSDHDEATRIEGNFEIVSLSGTVSVNGCHLHLSLSDYNGRTIGGHLKDGNLVYTTVEIVLGIFRDLRFERQFDPESGFPELVIQKL